MNEYTKALVELINENPDLPVLVRVAADVVGSDDYSWWQGVIGRSEVRDFVSYQMYGDGEDFVFKDNKEDLTEFISDSEKISEEEAEKKVNELDWKEAIFVNVNLP